MTEEEWVTGGDTYSMLRCSRSKGSDRKLRLFACARCRELWHMITDERSRMAVELGERYADGQATLWELNAAYEQAMLAFGAARPGQEAFATAALSVVMECEPDWQPCWETVWDQCPETAEQHALRMAEEMEIPLLRDIFGNPFRPIVADPVWLTPTVKSIAASLYQDRAFDRLPILADALEEAGCTNADVLLHCRQPGEHVRGCWVVDLVLGKK